MEKIIPKNKKKEKTPQYIDRGINNESKLILINVNGAIVWCSLLNIKGNEVVANFLLIF